MTDRQINGYDLHRWFVANNVPHLRWGLPISTLGVSGGFAVGWVLHLANGRMLADERPWPERKHGELCVHPETATIYRPDGSEFRPGPDDRVLCGWSEFGDAAVVARLVGVEGPWSNAVGQYRAEVWFPADSPLPKGVKRRKETGRPCRVHETRSLIDRCFALGHADKDGLCNRHASLADRRAANSRAWAERQEQNAKDRARRTELTSAAQDTADEINAVIADLLDLDLDARPDNGSPGNVTIDHEKARALVRRLADRA